MADINITLDATKAIADAEKLDLALEKLQKSARTLQTYTKKLKLSAMLKVPRLAGDIADIQKRLTAYTKVRPLKLRAIVAVDKRTKPLIETVHTRGGQFGKWYASADPTEHWASFGKPRPEDIGFEKKDKSLFLDEKEMRKGNKLWDEINNKRIKITKNFEGSLQDLKAKIVGQNDLFREGKITQNQYEKSINKIGKEYSTLSKEIDKSGKSAKAGQSAFAKFTRVLIATGAVIFIWQRVKAVIDSVVAVGEKYSATMIKSGDVSNQLTKAAEGTTFRLAGMHEAYTELMKAGLDSNEAIKKSADVLKIARHEKIKTADAAKILVQGTEKEIQAMLKLDDAMSKTAAEAKGKYKKAFADIFETLYMKQEPKLIDYFNNLSRWIATNKDDVVSGLEDISDAMLSISKITVKAGTGLVKFLGNVSTWLSDLIAPTPVDISKDQLSSLQDMITAREKLVNELIPQTIGFRKTEEDGVYRLYIKNMQMNQVYNDALKILNERIAANAKIIRQQKAITGKTGAPVIERIPDQNEIERAYRNIEGQTKIRHEAIKKQIDANYKSIILVAKLKGDTELLTKAEKYRADQYFKNDQDLIKPAMTAQQKYFKVTGKMSDEYYDNEVKKIKQTVKGYELEAGKQQELINLMIRRLDLERSEPKTKRAENLFQEIGVMSDYLKQERIDAAWSRLGTAIANNDDVVNAYKQFQNTLIDIDMDANARTLEIEEDKFDKLGILNQKYVDSFNTYVDLMKERLMSVYDVSPRDAEAYAQKLRDQFSLRTLEGVNVGDVTTGIETGMKRVQLAADSESVAKRVSDAWTQGAASVGQAWKSGLFVLMEMNFDNLEQAATNVLKSIQRMMIDVLYQMTMYGENGLITKLTGALPNLISTGGSSDAVSAANWSSVLNLGGQSRQAGGWITEPILGRGTRTGRPYALGEAGPEYVTPGSKAESLAKQPVSLKVNVQNQSGMELEGKQGEVRFDGESYITNVIIDSYVRNKRGMRDILRGR